MDIDVYFDGAKADKYLHKLKDQAIDKAVKKSLNRTASEFVKFAAKDTKKEVNLSVVAIKKSFKKYGAKGSNLSNFQSKVEVLSNPVPLIEYIPKSKREELIGAGTDASKKIGVLIRKSGGRKVIKGSKTGHKAFVAKLKSGKIGVFARKTKARLPIIQLFSSSVYNIFQGVKFSFNIQRKAQFTFSRNFNKNLSSEMSKLK